MKNSTGAIHSRLTNARAKYTKKKIASKVRYDSWLLKWTKSSPDETENPPRITAATFRIGSGSKKYQKATSYQKNTPRAPRVPNTDNVNSATARRNTDLSKLEKATRTTLT